MRIVVSADEARRTVLRRLPPQETALPESVRRVVRQTFGSDLDADTVARAIIADVRRDGDAAILRYNRALDGWRPPADTPLRVPLDEIEAAYEQVDEALVAALSQAAERIRTFHKQQLEHSLRPFSHGSIGQIVRPVQRVGIYVPGISAVYPSSVLMTVIPARVAGVKEIYLATPSDPDGRIAPSKLVAADIAGVDGVFRMGGAQAIAALACGTATVPRVDKICGPGGVFVTAAKRQVYAYGLAGIDGIYGPSETIVIADEEANPSLCAADLLAQAEHDALASPILITSSRRLADAVISEVERQLSTLERATEARAALQGQGGIIIVESLEEAVELANEYAPEHLCLLVDDPEALLPHVQSAGGVFLGEHSPEALGDYTAGPSHVMPTGGSARWASPLGVHDFLKVITVAAVGEFELREIGPSAVTIARAEGLTAHARSIERRLEQGD